MTDFIRQISRWHQDCTNLYVPGEDDNIACPIHLNPFRKRAREAWEAFVSHEAELRDLMDRAKHENVSEKLVKKCSEVLSAAFQVPAFELGFNGSKYDLILSPEGDRVKLFQLTYFAGCAPESIREHWNIVVGRSHSENYVLRMYGHSVEIADFQVWVEKCGEKKIALSLYSEKLLPLIKENENKAYSLAYILVDQVLGEIAAMRYVTGVQLLPAPIPGDSIPLADLPSLMGTDIDPQGWPDAANPQAACECYTAYRGTPPNEGSWPLRADAYAGMTCCLPLINAYFSGDDYYMDLLERDGAVPGFLFWPLENIRKEDILDLRDQIEEAILRRAGADAVTFTGGASGQTFGYLDFIAWDLPAVMTAAKEVLEATPLRQAGFHSFRMSVGGVGLKDWEM